MKPHSWLKSWITPGLLSFPFFFFFWLLIFKVRIQKAISFITVFSDVCEILFLFTPLFPIVLLVLSGLLLLSFHFYLLLYQVFHYCLVSLLSSLSWSFFYNTHKRVCAQILSLSLSLRMRHKTWYLFYFLIILLNIITSTSIHIPTNAMISFLWQNKISSCCVDPVFFVCSSVNGLLGWFLPFAFRVFS